MIELSTHELRAIAGARPQGSRMETGIMRPAMADRIVTALLRAGVRANWYTVAGIGPCRVYWPREL